MMKKVTLIIVTLTFLCVGFLNSQILLDETLLDAAVPAGWTILDEDGVAGDVFFTDQGIFAPSDWAGVNFGGAFGTALYSTGEFATVPTTASDWLITNQITLGPSSSIELELNALSTGCTFEIRIATVLAGATPVPTDFGTLVTPSLTLSGSQAWDSYDFDLTSFAGQMVYFAFVNTTVDAVPDNQVKVTGIRNIKVFQPIPDDASLLNISLGSVDVQTTDYLVNDLSFVSYSCLGNAAETVTLEILNNGSSPITTLDVGFKVDTSIIASESVNPPTPIPSGGTFSYTFSGTADFLTSGDDLYGLEAWVSIPNEGDRSNDTVLIPLVITPQTHDFLTEGNYEDNFDRINFGSGQIQNFETSWGWTLIDANNDGFTTDITPSIPGGALSGDYALTCPWNEDGTTPANDYAFSPCMSLKAGVGYKISVQAACGEDANGTYPETFRFMRNTVASNVGATIISDNDVTDPLYTEFSATFTVPTDDTYYLGFHINTPANRFFLNLDDFRVESFTGSPVAALSVSGQDALNGATYLEYCDSTITVNNTSTGIFDDVTIDWGDGSPTESFVGGGSLSHQYTAFGSYTITLTASNVVGSNSATADVDFTPLPAPTVTFGAPAVNDFTVGVTIGSSVGSNVVFTPSCSRLVIDWGDGTIDEVTGLANANHTYGGEGTYTITVTVIGSGQETASQDVTLTGPSSINEISFADAVSIYPNPSNELVNVSFALVSAENIELAIYAVDGKVVDVRSFSNVKEVNTSFNTATLNNGVYVMKITSDNGVTAQKFVVSHN